VSCRGYGGVVIGSGGGGGVEYKIFEKEEVGGGMKSFRRTNE
jgi:hypothetical protein